MNVEVRRKPFQKRKQSPIAAQATACSGNVCPLCHRQGDRAARAQARCLRHRLRQVSGRRTSPHRHPRHRRAADRSLANTPALGGHGNRFHREPATDLGRGAAVPRLAPNALVRPLCGDHQSLISSASTKGRRLGRRGPAGAGRRADQPGHDINAVQARVHRHRHPRDAARLQRRKADRRRAPDQDRLRPRQGAVRRLAGDRGQARGLALVQPAPDRVDLDLATIPR